MEWFNCKVDDRSKVVGGDQRIKTPDGYVFPLFIESGLVSMHSIWVATDDDLQQYTHVFFTSPDIWDASVLDCGITPALLEEIKNSQNLRLNPPEEEDQPQDLRSAVFVYGSPHPDGSEELLHASIFNFDDLLGRTFLLPMDENGERKQAAISDHLQNLDHTQASREN